MLFLLTISVELSTTATIISISVIFRRLACVAILDFNLPSWGEKKIIGCTTKI